MPSSTSTAAHGGKGGPVRTFTAAGGMGAAPIRVKLGQEMGRGGGAGILVGPIGLKRIMLGLGRKKVDQGVAGVTTNPHDGP